MVILWHLQLLLLPKWKKLEILQLLLELLLHLLQLLLLQLLPKKEKLLQQQQQHLQQTPQQQKKLLTLKRKVMHYYAKSIAKLVHNSSSPSSLSCLKNSEGKKKPFLFFCVWKNASPGAE
jgi:hypothetical protein